MEKNQYNLADYVLRELEKAGVLNKLILIGSWAVYYYKYYFDNKNYISIIRTRDMDFVIPLPYIRKRKY